MSTPLPLATRPFPSVIMPSPSLAVLSARAHKPLINFIGKRIWPSCAHCTLLFRLLRTHLVTAHAPAHPHPAAPPEYRKTFSGALQQTLNAGVAEKQSFRDFWQAPTHLWRPRHHELQEFEIDAIQVCKRLHLAEHADNTDLERWCYTTLTSAVSLYCVFRIEPHSLPAGAIYNLSNTLFSGSIFLRVCQEVLLHLSFIHHPPISPRLRILFVRRRHDSDLYLSWLVICRVHS